MLPKYIKIEIQNLVRQKLEESKAVNNDLDQSVINDILSHDTFWQTRHYAAAANILNLEPEELLAITPGEPLDSVSFRTEVNTEEINRTVAQVNDIFELLAYQLKIGQSS